MLPVQQWFLISLAVLLIVALVSFGGPTDKLAELTFALGLIGVVIAIIMMARQRS